MGRTKYKSYSEEQLITAVDKVKRGVLTKTQASKQYHVPRKTLTDYVSGKSKIGQKGGQIPFLTPSQDRSLANYARYMSERGFGITGKVLRTFALSIVQKQNQSSKTTPSKKWCQRFMKRHKLSFRKPTSLQRSRVAVSSQDIIDEYFTLLESTIDKLGLKDKPAQIWNADEAGFGKETEQIKQKVIAPTGIKNPYRQQMTDYEHITLLACASAAGNFMPNMLLYTKSLPTGRYASEMPSDWLYAVSGNGYITRNLFEEWFEKLFLPQLGMRRPNILIIDNHSSHLSTKVIDMAIDNKVEILGIPPHTSHFLQPLDQMFHCLRSTYCDLALNIGLIKADMVIKKNRFATIISQAQDKAWSPHLIKQGFRKTGLFPIDKDGIDKSFIRPNKIVNNEEKSAEGTQEEKCKTCGRTLTNPLVKAGLIEKHLHDILMPGEISKAEKSNKNQRLTGARIYTGTEMREELKRKAEESKEKEEGIKRRKQEREAKRIEKNEVQLKKRKIKEKKARAKESKSKQPTKISNLNTNIITIEAEIHAVGDNSNNNIDNEEDHIKVCRPRRNRKKQFDIFTAEDDDDDMYICGVCAARGKKQDEQNGIHWIGCDNEGCLLQWYHYDCLGHNDQATVDLSLLFQDIKWLCPLCNDSNLLEE